MLGYVAVDTLSAHPWWSAFTAFACLLVTLKTLRATLWAGRQRAYKDDVIYVHMFPRHYTKKVVNLSPYAIKLETWLRMNGIRYEVVETARFSKTTRQIPYVILNGQEYTDSNLIIAMLAERHGLDVAEGLTSEQQAVSRALTLMLDDHTAWTYFMFRYVFHLDTFAKYFRIISRPWPLYKIIPLLMKRGLRDKMGRKSEATIVSVGIEDIRAISRYLGDKQYLFGDTPTKADCGVFGHLSQVLYPDMPYPHRDFIQTECPNLVRYMEHMRQTYWADWDSLVECDTFQ